MITPCSSAMASVPHRRNSPGPTPRHSASYPCFIRVSSVAEFPLLCLSSRDPCFICIPSVAGAERTGTAMPACPGDRVQVDRGNLFLAKRLGSLGVSSVRAISRDFEAGRACLRLAARRAGCAPAVPLLFPRIKADQGVSTTEGSDVHGKIERRGQRRRQRKAITRRARPAPTAGRSRNGGPASTGSRVRRGGW